MPILGIDLGTTKSAAVLYTPGAAPVSCSRENQAGYGTQSVEKILNSAIAAVRGLPEDLRKKVTEIGVTGQMHGVLAWSGTEHSGLENWQSPLAQTSGTLKRITRIPGCENLASGFGFATLAVSGWRRQYRHAATIMDYFAALLTRRKTPATDPTNAASWGLWNIRRGDWNRNAIRALEIPEEILPQIVPSGSCLGPLCREWSERLGIPADIPVRVPLGDNPAALLGSGGVPETDLFLTVGTGAQLAFIPNGKEAESCGALELRPFPGGRLLAVSASLCGGKAMEVLADFIGDVLNSFSVSVPRGEIYRKLSEEVPEGISPLTVSTHFTGERNNPALRGGIAGIGMDNLRFHPLCRAWCEGILNALLNGFPQTVLTERRRLVVNGNAIRKSPLFRQVIRERFPDLENILPENCEEAACGAAIYCADYGL